MCTWNQAPLQTLALRNCLVTFRLIQEKRVSWDNMILFIDGNEPAVPNDASQVYIPTYLADISFILEVSTVRLK